MRVSRAVIVLLLALLSSGCVTSTWVEVTRRPIPAADEGAILATLPPPVTVSAGTIENYGLDWLRSESWTDGAVAALRSSGVAPGARVGEPLAGGTHVTVEVYVDTDEHWWANMAKAVIIGATLFIAEPLLSFDSDCTGTATWTIDVPGRSPRTLRSEAVLGSVRHLFSSPREIEMLMETKLIELTSADLAVQAGLHDVRP